MNKKASITLYFVLIIVATVLITMTAVIAPMGAEINSIFYAAGADMLENANKTISSISDASVKASLTESFNEALDSQEENIRVHTDLYQYSWILVLGLTAIVAFLFTRANIERGGGGIY